MFSYFGLTVNKVFSLFGTTDCLGSNTVSLGYPPRSGIMSGDGWKSISKFDLTPFKKSSSWFSVISYRLQYHNFQDFGIFQYLGMFQELIMFQDLGIFQGQ